jgi:LmbE family N-acetylglucosaminyl deacetylase
MIRPLVCLVLASTCSVAQTPWATSIAPALDDRDLPVDRGAAALWQSLKKLQTRASLIMITAHPDDEDGAMLAHQSRGLGARAALLTLNRGEGGANVMSADYFDALGLVRTMELLAAGRYYGVEQHFTRVVDYGFSKTKAESIGRWTHDRVLADVVRVIRAVRPLVITSVFVGGPSDGHGNHETAGAMAQEAFRAAADPNAFPDAGRPWAALKVYARVRSGEAHVAIPHGDYDPLLGASYTQIGREGLGFQKSQNGGPLVPRPGQASTAYRRFASRVQSTDKETSFFDGIDVSIAPELQPHVKQALAAFDAAHPERCAPALAAGLKATLQILQTATDPDVRHELEIKRVQFNNALAHSLGLSISAETDHSGLAIPGQTVNVRVAAVSQAPVQLARLWVEPGPPPAPPTDLLPNRPSEARGTVTIPADAAYTRPYFSRPDLEQSYYDLHDPKLLGAPLPPYPLAGWAEFTYQGVPIRIARYVQTIRRVTGLGAVYEPLAIGPPIGVAIAPRAGIVPLDAKSFPVSVALRKNVENAAGTVRLEVPQGWSVTPASIPFSASSTTFTVTPASLAERAYRIAAVASYAGREYREGYDVTGYPGLRPYFLYRPATLKTSGVNVTVAPGLKIAYVMGTGDDVPAALENLGVKVAFLSSADLAAGDLAQYDAILLGVRAYAARSDLIASNARLLDYVKNGGVAIVQYNTPEFDRNFGPYPYVMGRNPEEVTDEESEVKILNPGHALFQWPNRITEKDFTGWVEERGSKWMQSWDPQYEPLLETHDAGQAPQKGGLLYARYGKGIYIYNAWAFYRQLPEGVPGAFRIFANLLSLPKNPKIR